MDAHALPHGRGRGKNNKPDPHYPPPMTDHRPVRDVVAIRRYDPVGRVVYGENDVLHPEGLRRILTDEGYHVLGELDGRYLPFNLAVETLWGRYMVAR